MNHWRFVTFTLVLISMVLFGEPIQLAAGSPALMPPADGFLSGCTGEYFNNITHSGSPVLVRTDGSINFVWGPGVSPGSGVPGDNFSVRWTCTVNAPTSNNYTFTMKTDDGMNLLVDGSLVVWAFFDQGPTTYFGTVYLNAGNHTVKVEYYNKWNTGTAQVSSPLGSGGGSPPPSGNWNAEYYNNQTLSGSPTLTRNESNLSFDWGGGSPDGAIPVDHFSARWTTTAYLNAGTWRFTAASDDGVRVWVDSTLIIDKWYNHSYIGYNVDVSMGAGNHTIRVEYYDDVGAAAVALAYGQLGGGVPPPPAPPSGSGLWHGQYFNNISLSGSPAFVRDDYALNFNWYEGVPVPGLPADYWSAKWDSTQNFPSAGSFTISAAADDGVRVWMDGTLLIDGWYDHLPTTFTATPYVSAGLHNFHVEYYDRGYGAMINVQIGGSGGTLPPPPSSGAEVVVDDQGAGWQAGGFSPWYATFGINGHAFWALNHTYVAYGYDWARWYPALTAPGNYEVFAYIPGGYGTTLYARYWIRHGGAYNLVVRPQAFNPNAWMSLGTYYFNAAGGEYVSLADVTYECPGCTRVAFDAIKFSPR